MAALDWVVLSLLAGSLLLGLVRGLVYEVLSVLAWIAAFVLAQWLAPRAAALLPIESWGEGVRYAAGFVLVFVATVFGGALLAWITKKLVHAVGLKPADRALGGLFGLVRGVVLVLALGVVVHLLAFDRSSWWTESVSGGVTSAALRGLRPALPESVGQYLPS